MNLQIITHENQLVVDSRQVAEMVKKQHKNLMADIRNYSQILTSASFSPLDFFIESTYKDNKGEVRPCYLITKKGCDMVANKMTGEKGILFTANYIEKFYEMEQQLRKPMSQLEITAANAIALLEQDKTIKQITCRQDAHEQQLQSIRNIVVVRPDRRKQWIQDTINAIIKKNNFDYSRFKTETYVLLNQRMGVNICIRKFNKQRRIGRNVSCLEIILGDKKIAEGYVAIIKEYAIRYGVAA